MIQKTWEQIELFLKNDAKVHNPNTDEAVQTGVHFSEKEVAYSGQIKASCHAHHCEL